MPNLSQMKRERMMAFLQKIKDEHRDDDEMLIALGEIESELNAKKYGLVWEQHEEAVDVMMQDNIPVFTEVAEKEIVAAPGEGFNFILEGDNLHSLRLLEKTHKGRIDLIYIDPPYNTGNKDFVYDDAFVDKTDLFSHSKWLSFMEKRLRIAGQLLSDNGVIFISIDDNEQAPLKMLCDDLFGAECFVANVSWQRTYSMRNDSKGIPAEVEHILVYSKNIGWIKRSKPGTAGNEDRFHGFARSHFEFLILLHRKMVRLLFFQLCKKEVNWALISLVVLPGFAGIDKIQQRYEILFLLRGLVPDVANQSGVIQPLRLYPKVLAGLFTFTLGIHNQSVHQLQDILLRANIRQRVVFHGLFEID